MKPYFARTGGLLLWGVSLGGCQFSASASADVKSSGDANTQAQAQTGANADAGKPHVAGFGRRTITLKEGKLDYQGVINFEYDKANLKKDTDTDTTLAEFKKFLTEHPNVNVEVEGHTDSRGTDEYNRDLSDRRAASVRQWLVDNGIAKERVTSVGKGEDHPQVPEPDACNDKDPKDTAPCEQTWAANRRVVFQVTKGAETIPAEPAAPAPPPPPPPVAEAPPPAAKEACPWLWGGHLNALGPNSWVTVAGATQPGVCWLELSLGAGLGWGDVSGEASGANGDGDYFSLTVPLRARFWFMDTHSLIGDAGFGFSNYWLSADLDDAGGIDGDYERNMMLLVGHLGAGYGYRGNGAQAGPRLALLVGLFMHLTQPGDSTTTTDAGFVGGPALSRELDSDTQELDDIEPYGEISFGYLF